MIVVDVIGLVVNVFFFLFFAVIGIIVWMKGYEDAVLVLFPLAISATGAYWAWSLIRKKLLSEKLEGENRKN